jgi:hypothetical protein
MKEEVNNRNALTYAVKLKSIEVDWIFNEKEGLDFLKEMIKQNNKEIFGTEYTKIIIKYLYGIFS